jgi:hypothetical protein
MGWGRMLLLGNVGLQPDIGDLAHDSTADGRFNGPVTPA